MKKLSLFLFAASVLAIYSCETPITEYAIDWTNDIKAKIIEDANETPDSIYKSSEGTLLEYYKAGRILKEIHLHENLRDTILSILHSTDLQFKLLREHCPLDRSFFGIRVKDRFCGYTELRFCNGKIKTTGFRYLGQDVGVWTTYDQSGKIIETKDLGNVEKLENLKLMQYSR